MHPFLLTYTAVILLGVTLGMAAFLLMSRREALVARYLGYYALAISVWIGSNAMADVQFSEGPLIFWVGLAMIGAAWSVVFYLAFITSFVTGRSPRPSFWLWSLPALVLSTTAFSKLDIVESYFPPNAPTQSLPGPMFAVFMWYLFIGMAYGSAKLAVFYWRKASHLQRQQVMFLQTGFAITFAGMGVFAVILPLYGEFRFFTLGTQFAAFFVAFSSYAILRLGLLDVKILVSQLLVLLLLGANFVGILAAESTFGLWRNVAAFVITGVMGAYLIQSIKREALRREELEELSQRLSKTNADLREADKVRTEFLSIASHQLRTPLTVIKGYLSLMREGAYGLLPDPAIGKVGHLFEMNERMIQSISNLLNVTRIEKKRIQYNIGAVDVNVALAQLADDMKFKAEQVEGRFVFSLPEIPLPQVKADADKMREVLSNLIDNAFKYAPRGGTVTLAASYLPKEKKVKFTVTDTGMGISEKDAKKLFQQFYRAGAKATGIEGTGIGLFICKTFAEGMGGKVWLESSLIGKGSTFAFTLPIVRQ